MVDRIREILSVRQLTPTQFADSIGVARPIVSHILSGRNKPSLEVVQKIIAAFPELSLQWLLNGTGDMLAAELSAAPAPQLPGTAGVSRRPARLAPETPQPESGVTSSYTDAVAFAKTPTREHSELVAPTGTGSDVTAPPALAPLPQAGFSTAVPAPSPGSPAASTSSNLPPPLVPAANPAVSASTTQSVATPVATPSPEPIGTVGVPPTPLAQLSASPEKQIRRIVIFYQDGTFSDYQPETNPGL